MLAEAEEIIYLKKIDLKIYWGILMILKECFLHLFV